MILTDTAPKGASTLDFGHSEDSRGFLARFDAHGVTSVCMGAETSACRRFVSGEVDR